MGSWLSGVWKSQYQQEPVGNKRSISSKLTSLPWSMPMPLWRTKVMNTLCFFSKYRILQCFERVKNTAVKVCRRIDCMGPEGVLCGGMNRIVQSVQKLE